MGRQSEGDSEQKEAVLSYMEKAASRQGGTVNPANIRSNIVMLHLFICLLFVCELARSFNSYLSGPQIVQSCSDDLGVVTKLLRK